MGYRIINLAVAFIISCAAIHAIVVRGDSAVPVYAIACCSILFIGIATTVVMVVLDRLNKRNSKNKKDSIHSILSDK